MSFWKHTAGALRREADAQLQLVAPLRSYDAVSSASVWLGANIEGLRYSGDKSKDHYLLRSPRLATMKIANFSLIYV